MIFYTLDQDSAPPVLTRRATCLACHVSDGTLGVPGLIARSHMVDRDGEVIKNIPHCRRASRPLCTQRTFGDQFRQYRRQVALWWPGRGGRDSQ